MSPFSKQSLASLEISLFWEESRTSHEEIFIARRVNPWRDIFPGSVLALLEGKHVGETISCQYQAGELVPPWSETRLFSFRRPKNLRLGRFYPQGLLEGLPGVYPQTLIPFRVIERDTKTFLADTNHPLSRFALRWQGRILEIQEKRSDTGGSVHHWAEEICNGGPGMQASFTSDVDFLSPDFFSRTDDDDVDFYTKPRFIGHVDARASSRLKDLYGRFLQPGMRVLDMLSSIQSHLPDIDVNVTGLGLNAEELEANPRLSTRLVHDLNAEPGFDCATQTSFDAVLCSLSFEYLVQPEAVLRQIRKHIKPGGVLLISVSDRWFPTKVISGWCALHPFERPAFILQTARQAGFSGPAGTISVRNDWRPQDDPHFLATRGISDALHLVWIYA